MATTPAPKPGYTIAEEGRRWVVRFNGRAVFSAVSVDNAREELANRESARTGRDQHAPSVPSRVTKMTAIFRVPGRDQAGMVSLLGMTAARWRRSPESSDPTWLAFPFPPLVIALRIDL